MPRLPSSLRVPDPQRPVAIMPVMPERGAPEADVGVRGPIEQPGQVVLGSADERLRVVRRPPRPWRLLDELVSCLRKRLVLGSPPGYAPRYAENTPSQADRADGRRTSHVGAMDSATEHGAAAGPAVADRAGLRRGSPQPGGRRTGAGVEQQRLHMARAVSRPPRAGLDRRAAARRAAQSDRRSDRGRDDPHARRPADSRHAVDDAKQGLGA